MSHLHPAEKPPHHRKSSCRKGRHDYGAAQHIGGGITRQVCRACNDVTIDLSGAHEAGAPIISGNRGLLSLVTRDADES